jgi:hypothetical protein
VRYPPLSLSLSLYSTIITDHLTSRANTNWAIYDYISLFITIYKKSKSKYILKKASGNFPCFWISRRKFLGKVEWNDPRRGSGCTTG